MPTEGVHPGAMDPDDAAAALAEIRGRQAQVIDTSILPDWFFWLVAGLVVVPTAAAESRNPVAIGAAIIAGLIGLVVGVGRLARRAVQVQLRNDLLGPRGVLLILGFVALSVGAGLGAAFSLRAAGIAYPGTLGTIVCAAVLVVAGPRLMRALRRIMMANRAAGRP